MLLCIHEQVSSSVKVVCRASLSPTCLASLFANHFHYARRSCTWHITNDDDDGGGGVSLRRIINYAFISK
uniref:Uncharacterized protein n=1 Tax=Trichogramma kaykai TaxID=54128 RepID=A0ABD2XC98_9HYME